MNEIVRDGSQLKACASQACTTESPVDHPVTPCNGKGLIGGLLSRGGYSTLALLPDSLRRQRRVSWTLGRRRVHFVSDPEIARAVLRAGSDSMRKPELLFRLLRPVMGKGIMLAEDEIWRNQRRCMAPAFAQRSLESIVPLIDTVAKDLCASVAREPGEYGFDFLVHSTRATYQVVRSMTVGPDAGPEQRQIDDAFRRLLGFGGVVRSVLANRNAGASWPFEDAKVAALLASAATALRMSKRRGQERPAILDALLMTSALSGFGEQDEEASVHQLLTLLVAGFDTTAVALAWATYLATFRENLQDAIAEEAATACGCTEGADVRTILRTRPLARSVIRETLRLYPPAAILARAAIQAADLAGLDVRPRDLVVISIYAMHRHSAHWADADTFDPYRFTAPEADGNPAYMPFGFGPRVCIAQHLAELELTVFLSELLRHFRFGRVDAKPPQPLMSLTLRPEGGMWLKAAPRAPAKH